MGWQPPVKGFRPSHKSVQCEYIFSKRSHQAFLATILLFDLACASSWAPNAYFESIYNSRTDPLPVEMNWENPQDCVCNEGDTQDASDLSKEPSHLSVSFSTAGLPDRLGTHATCTLLSWSEWHLLQLQDSTQSWALSGTIHQCSRTYGPSWSIRDAGWCYSRTLLSLQIRLTLQLMSLKPVAYSPCMALGRQCIVCKGCSEISPNFSVFLFVLSLKPSLQGPATMDQITRGQTILSVTGCGASWADHSRSFYPSAGQILFMDVLPGLPLPFLQHTSENSAFPIATYKAQESFEKDVPQATCFLGSATSCPMDHCIFSCVLKDVTWCHDTCQPEAERDVGEVSMEGRISRLKRDWVAVCCCLSSYPTVFLLYVFLGPDRSLLRSRSPVYHVMFFKFGWNPHNNQKRLPKGWQKAVK